MSDNSEASIEQTDLIKPSKMSYIVRAQNGSVVKITGNLNEAIKTADEMREMKKVMGEDFHCEVEERVIVYSTNRKPDKDDEYNSRKKPSPYRNF